mmetsp:Transcript_24490/g.63220  ORF Transcript_24490/g.63220 Transcript_24490/m.63220 type:complete len:203 (-) Transcript_24490:322-930(-)
MVSGHVHVPLTSPPFGRISQVFRHNFIVVVACAWQPEPAVPCALLTLAHLARAVHHVHEPGSAVHGHDVPRVGPRALLILDAASHEGTWDVELVTQHLEEQRAVPAHAQLQLSEKGNWRALRTRQVVDVPVDGIFRHIASTEAFGHAGTDHLDALAIDGFGVGGCPHVVNKVHELRIQPLVDEEQLTRAGGGQRAFRDDSLQ